MAQIAEHKRPATINLAFRRLRFTTQNYDGRDTASFGVESHQTGVAILMRYEEIANAVAKKLWLFTLFQLHIKILLGSIFVREKFLSYEIYCFPRRLNANCPAYHLIDCS